MNLFDGVISIQSITFLMFTVLAIAAVGYAFGRITIKGISLGTSGVFIVALLFGCFLYGNLEEVLVVTKDDTSVSYIKEALKLVENLGLILFVTSVGFIAGPNFFGNFKKNFKSYVLLALIIIIAGALSCAGCIVVDKQISGDSYENIAAMLVGLLSGSLTSTPAFSAAKATVAESVNIDAYIAEFGAEIGSARAAERASELENIVTVGHGIAYLFGVIGVVLFVQIIPKILKVNMAEERKSLVAADSGAKTKKTSGKHIEMDEFGFMAFSLAALTGVFVGSVKIGNFSLTTTGGCLLISLIFGHFTKFGPVCVMPKEGTLKVFREFGLMLFLIGAGISGGAKFVEYFKAIYFIYGIIMTIIPMIIGFLFAKYVLKLRILNNLGSITGGMTSTPALGTLINTAGTENVASAYAATYPVALISVVVASQVLILLFS